MIKINNSRDTTQILFDMLKEIKKGGTKGINRSTLIVRSNLTSGRSKHYFQYVTQKGLIAIGAYKASADTKDRFVLTPKGLEAIEKYEQLQQYIDN